MDCLLTRCSSNSPPRRTLKKQWSSRRHADEAFTQEPCREWPSDPEQYEVLEFAGKGAHAVVYKGRCKAFEDELVAIKRLDLDCNWDLTALIREATLMKKFSHPSVLPLHSAFVAGRELWLVTRFMGLGSARSIMKQHFPLGLDEVVVATIMHPVLEALEYVHKNGGIHRDVKADNILVSEEGGVVLADFGVAAARGRPVSMVNMHDMQAVMATTFIGTPCWMAPEVMRQAEEGYHTSADIWSFGITLIELAHGRPPLARMHPMRVLMDTMNKPAPQLNDHPHGTQFSKAFKDLVEECLQKDPDLRPSATALLGHRFWRMARDPGFLQQHFLAGLATPQQQQQRQQQPASPGAQPRPLGTTAAAAGPAHHMQAGLPAVHQRPQQSYAGGAAPAGAAAGRAGSGLLASAPSCSGPSRHSSGWFFPPGAPSSRLSTHSEDPWAEGAPQHRAGPASSSAALSGSASGSATFGSSSSSADAAAQPAHATSSSGSSACNLEQQLQPFLLQQAALRAGSVLGPGLASGPSASGGLGLGLRLGSTRQFGGSLPNMLLEPHPEAEGPEDQEEQEQEDAGDRLETATRTAAAAAGATRGMRVALRGCAGGAAATAGGVQEGSEGSVGVAAAAGAELAPAPAATRGSSYSSSCGGSRSSTSSSGGSRSSGSSIAGLTQDLVEAMLAPTQQQEQEQQQSTQRPPQPTAASPAEPAAHGGAAQAPASPYPCGSDAGAPAGLEAPAAADAVFRVIQSGALPLKVCAPAGSCSGGVEKHCHNRQRQQQQQQQCEEPPAAAQASCCCRSPLARGPAGSPCKSPSFRDALGFLSELRGRVLSSPRGAAAKAAAAAAAKAASAGDS